MKIVLGVLIVVTLAVIGTASILTGQMTHASHLPVIIERSQKAPVSITGDNVYVTWWTNKSGHDEVMFRASTDGGKSFGDKINLSNTTNDLSTRAEIDSDGNSVVVSWWETNETSDVPVMKVSDDQGNTFGPMIKLGANGSMAN